MNTVSQESSYSFFVIMIIGLVVIAGISVFVLQWWSGQAQEQPWHRPLNYDTLRSWWSSAPVATAPVATAPMPAAPGAASAVSERYPTKHQKESWCFVGEDLTGRYCVKVPSEKSCDADRVFGTRKDCELTPANHMATGIVKQNGESMLPLAKMRFG